MTVLLGTDVTFWFHRKSAHRATWTTGGDQRRRFLTQMLRLASGNAQINRFRRDRFVFYVIIQHVVSGNNDPVLPDVKSQLDSSDPKLMSRFRIEIVRDSASRLDPAKSRRELLQHLFDGHPERLDLLFLHPEYVGFATRMREQPKTTTSGLAEGVDTNSRVIAKVRWESIERI